MQQVRVGYQACLIAEGLENELNPFLWRLVLSQYVTQKC